MEPALFMTGSMDWRIHRFDEVDSTNEVAFGAIARGAGRAGDVFVAQRQTAGRGTRGRVWVSEPGGLYLSVILQTPELPLAGLWTIAGALAAFDLAEALGATARLDWPNDLVNEDGAKLGGILAESRGLGPEGPATYVLGIGVNLLAGAFGGPAQAEVLKGRAVAAIQEGPPSNSAHAQAESILLTALVERTRAAREEPAALFQSFFERCVQARSSVRVEIAGRIVSGIFTALDPVRGVCLAPASGSDTEPAIRWLPLAHVRSMTVSD